MYYTLEQLLYQTKTEELWSPSFAYVAEDESDALEKAKKWARYHGHSIHEVRVRPATENERINWVHNDWVQ